MSEKSKEVEESVDMSLLAALELGALKALVRLASEGNAAAAASAITCSERIRKTRLGELHLQTMESLSKKPVELARYLGTLGVDEPGVASRTGHALTVAERKAWELGQEERLLEVRAVELGRMRRGDGDVPRWAMRKAGGER